jgi:N-formylglutamate deformylase
MIEVMQGKGPIILGLPHTGTDIPNEIRARLNDRGHALADTDWHIDRLYDGVLADVTRVRTPIHRYVIDVNRGPDDQSLYPGQNTTGLCPITDFDGQPIYLKAQEPDAEETRHRIETWHAPYHAALSAEIERVRKMHGCAILYDCHSIRSHIPHLFEGTLPDLNIGTNSSASCAPVIEASVVEICRANPAYSTMLNGRFKGGWTTRHYGRPEEGVHAIQMELAQSTYMTEAPPWFVDDRRWNRLRSHLAELLDALQNLVNNGALR